MMSRLVLRGLPQEVARTCYEMYVRMPSGAQPSSGDAAAHLLVHVPDSTSPDGRP